MRKKAMSPPKRRGAPTKSRLNHRRLARIWSVFLKNNPSLTQEVAAAKFRRLYGEWIDEDLGMRVGGYGSLRNATRVGKREHKQVSSERHRNRRRVTTGLFGKPRLVTRAHAALEEAQEAYLLAGIGSDRSLANLSG
jgi:hypothetical protein